MAGRLAAVPEESTMAAYPPRSVYHDLIRSVAMSGAQIRPTLFSHSQSQSGHSGSSYSSGSHTSNSYPSHSSVCSSGSALSAVPVDSGTLELKTIARRMASDGYTQRMVKAFNNASPAPRRVLESWFLELDVDWVLQIRENHGLQWLQDKSASSLQDLVERWTRGLTVIVHSIGELVFPDHNELEGVARFGKASITEMLAFVDAVVAALKAEKLQVVLGMYICLCTSYMVIPVPMHTESRIVFNEIRSSLAREGNRLNSAIFSTMKEVRTLVEDDDLWAIEILRGRGEVHKNTRLMVYYIVYIKQAVAMMDRFTPVDKNSSGLEGLISDTIYYLKDLLSRKSELCSDPSLRYLFLLNNSYFVEQLCEPSRPPIWYAPDKIQLTPECEKYMHCYFHVSWGHVLSCCMRKSRCPGPIHRWINTSSLDKFELAVRKTCQAHKFWKVPDPMLRNELRKFITTRVGSGYRDYLEEHPELMKYLGPGRSSPEVLEEMLQELFEG